MKKIWKKILAYGLAVVTVLSVSAGDAIPARAMDEYEDYEEYDPYENDDWEDDYYNEVYEEWQEGQGSESGGESGMLPTDEEDPSPTQGYNLAIDKTSLSFGNIFQGAAVYAQEICLYNNGSNDISLIWKENDPNYEFYIDAPASVVIPAGSARAFTVMPETKSPTGSYTATYFFADASDPAYQYGVSVTVTCTIKAEEPYISSVTVSPGSATVAKGGSCQFDVSLQGGNNPNWSVNWTIAGCSSAGTNISDNGLLTVAADEESTSLRVTATSVQDPSVSDIANVTITNKQYTIGVFENPSEGGSASGGGTVNEGESVRLLAAPSNGWKFVNWTLNGSVLSENADFTYKNIRQSGTVVANFTKTACRITTRVNNSNAGTVTDSATVSYGGSITLTAKAKENYKFDGWQENGNFISNAASINLNNVTSDRTLTAVFSREKYSVVLSCNPDSTGVLQGAGKYNGGQSVKISAKPVDGYNFVAWVYNGNVVSRESEFKINEIWQDYCITAVFEQVKKSKTYQIVSGVTSDNGVISPSGTYTFQEGKTVSYTISPKKGYIIQGVEIDGVQYGAITSFTFANLDGNHRITASFIPKPAENNQQQQAQTKPESTKPDSTASKPDNSQDITPTQQQQAEMEVDNQKTDILPMQNTEDLQEDPEYFDLDSQTGVLQLLNITDDAARAAIESGQDKELLEFASQMGFLNVTIHSDYASITQETGDKSYFANTSVPNFGEVVSSLLSEDEEMNVLKGAQVNFNLNIFNNDEHMTALDKECLDAYKDEGIVIGSYFNIVLIKDNDGDANVVSELSVPMKVVMQVPDNLVKPGRQFCVIRKHINNDGTVSVAKLVDEDNDDSTITYSTDAFSAYAIGYVDDESANSGADKTGTIKIVITVVIAVAALGIVITAGTMATQNKKKKEQAKRRAAKKAADAKFENKDHVGGKRE